VVLLLVFALGHTPIAKGNTPTEVENKTTTANSVTDILRGAKRAWRPSSAPITKPKLAAIEKKLRVRLPQEYRDVLLTFGAGALYGSEGRVLLIEPEHLAQFNPHPDSRELAAMVIFGHDEGDFFFFFDRKNLLGRSAWSIFTVEMGVMTRKGSTFVARDLRELFQRILRVKTDVHLR
jgi:hypothetical protein